MRSLRAAAQKAGLDQPPLSVRNMAKRFRLPEPLSLLRLLEELAPDRIVFETGHVEAGDVSGSARLGLLSTGWWSFKGHLKDSGDFFGDNYVFAAVLNHVDQSGKTLRGVKKEGTLDGGDSEDFQVDGRDSWIAENWDAIKSKGFRWKLHADTHASAGEVLEFVMGALFVGAVVGAIILWMALEGGAGNANCYWDKDGLRICEY